jgi:methylated-DNA-protein-cysteine methyltransferase-like protein
MRKKYTDIDQHIWQVIMLIPPGKVATYGDVACHAGLPGAARRVGYALKNLPQDTRIPWHRVINAQGKIALRPGGAEMYVQMERLHAEGIHFSSSQRVDLKLYRWQPR